MEKLYRRSDGICETPSGLFAIIPLFRSGDDGTNAWFEYRTHATSEVFRLEWPSDTDFVVIEATQAAGLLNLRYARSPLANEIDAYNAVVEEFAKQVEPDPSVPTAEMDKEGQGTRSEGEGDNSPSETSDASQPPPPSEIPPSAETSGEDKGTKPAKSGK